VNDGKLDSAGATITIHVAAVNDAPTANAQSLTVNEDTPLAITLTGADVDLDAFTFSVGTPLHGTLTGTAPNLIYTPNTNYFGPDSFSFQTVDGQTNSAPAAVSITVLPVNDAPVADASATPLRTIISANNLNALAVLDGSRSSDVDNDPLQFLWTERGVAIATGMVTTVTLPIGSHGITLRVSDGLAAATDAVTIDILAGTHTVQDLINLVKNSGLSKKRIHSLLEALDDVYEDIQRGKTKHAIEDLHEFQNRVRAQIRRSDPVLAAKLIHEAQLIIDSIGERPPKPKLAIHAEHDEKHNVQIKFDGNGARSYVVEASDDMIHWAPVGWARHLGEGQFQFDDKNGGADKPHRFYRVQVP
jgi:hypothetical protein